MADEIQRIKTDIALRQAVIFIGDCVSFQTTHDEQEISEHRIRRSFQSEEGSYKRSFIETTDTSSVKHSEFITAIGELGCPILTSNYDLSLEEALNRQPLTWNDYQHTDSDLHDCILHIYGHIQEPESMIVTGEDVALKLKIILGSKTLLFIGYGARMFDMDFSNILKWIDHVVDHQSLSIYKLVQSTQDKKFKQSLDISFLDNVKEIPYGITSEDLLSFIENLKSFTPIIRHSYLTPNNRQIIRKKYLNYLIEEYGHVSILGCSNENINLPLESVYVELKFDPTHPSIKAMKTLEIHEEFKRKLLSPDFFDEDQYGDNCTKQFSNEPLIMI